MEALTGGRPGVILRDGARVVRPAGPWSPTVQRFLAYLRARGFESVPAPLGFDQEGHEIVGWVEGEVFGSLDNSVAASAAVLESAAALLRAFHDASAGFLAADRQTREWMLPAREPAELVCHGDFAPYNVTVRNGRAHGLIDFDTAHPAPRLWDLAYAVYRWAPLSRPGNDGVPFDMAAQIERARRFCDIYGATADQRAGLAAAIAARLAALVDFMRARAIAGEAAMAANVAAGHDALYLDDAAYVSTLAL